jgi:hypothetical protein
MTESGRMPRGERSAVVMQMFDVENSKPGVKMVYKYRVKTVNNSTTPNVGQDLSEQEVNELMGAGFTIRVQELS